VVERLVAALGAGKLMWGSDIAQTKVPYPEMVEMLKEACAGLSAADRDQIFNGTCQRIYGAMAGSETTP
jgi:L-fuconolactonase